MRAAGRPAAQPRAHAAHMNTEKALVSALVPRCRRALLVPYPSPPTMARTLARSHRQAERGASLKTKAQGSHGDLWIGDTLPWTGAESRAHEPALAPAGAPPIVICPGFGNCSEDYMAPFGKPEHGVVASLRERGWHVEVVRLQRRAWFQVARNLFTRGFWSSSLTTHPGYTWYLDRLASAVLAAQEATGSEAVHLVGHSAGGWLARAFLGDPRHGALPEGMGPNPAVASLVSLGTPHRPPPPDSGARDMTGGALGWVEARFPGVRYVAVAGRSVRSNRAAPARSLPGYAAGSYEQVCGQSDGIEGDGVVPLEAALLPGAKCLVLDGVVHSMSKVGTFDAPGSRPWYGSPQVVDAWLHALLDHPAQTRANTVAAQRTGAEVVLSQLAAEMP